MKIRPFAPAGLFLMRLPLARSPRAAGLGGLSRRRFALGALSGLALMQSGAAQAHARLRSAEPPDGASIHTPPDQVALTFSEAVELAFSRIQVTDAAGARVDRDDLRRDPEQPTRLITGLPKLPPGAYLVEWKVTSVDTHKSEGRYTFTLLGN